MTSAGPPRSPRDHRPSRTDPSSEAPTELIPAVRSPRARPDAGDPGAGEPPRRARTSAHLALGVLILVILLVGGFWLLLRPAEVPDEQVVTVPTIDAPSVESLPEPSAPPERQAALGDRQEPFGATTAVEVLAAGQRAGLSADGGAPVEDPDLCEEYPGCRSAATLGDVTAVVFETARAAQDWRDETREGATADTDGGLRYWAYVDATEVEDPDTRSAWRDLLREVVP